MDADARVRGALLHDREKHEEVHPEFEEAPNNSTGLLWIVGEILEYHKLL